MMDIIGNAAYAANFIRNNINIGANFIAEKTSSFFSTVGSITGDFFSSALNKISSGYDFIKNKAADFLPFIPIGFNKLKDFVVDAKNTLSGMVNGIKSYFFGENESPKVKQFVNTDSHNTLAMNDSFSVALHDKQSAHIQKSSHSIIQKPSGQLLS